MLNITLTTGCFAIAALSGYCYGRLRHKMPVSAMHLGVSAVFFTAIGFLRVYHALSESSYFQNNALSTRTFVRE